MSADAGELDYIDWIRARVAQHPRLPIGIGDDAALFRFPEPSAALVTVDMLMEGVHFTIPSATPRQIGRKALAVNLSDIAAMAGRPLAAVVSLALPRSAHSTAAAGTSSFEFAQELHAGLQELADEFSVIVAGGDTNSWNGPLVISVTLLGETTPRGPVKRSGAQVGDWIFTTGSLGGSLAGRHFSFQPRVDAALQLHAAVDLHAMIDISDGLAADLYHILDASQVGAVLIAAAIPISDSVTAPPEKTRLDHALGDGEDFELLFAVSPEDGRKLLNQPPIDLRLSHIGEMTTEKKCTIVDANGTRRDLPRSGWQHPL